MTNPTILPLLQQQDDTNLPLIQPQQPAASFAAHIANPANLQALAGSLVPPTNVKPVAAPQFWNSKSNLLAPTVPQRLATIPQQPVQTASQIFPPQQDQSAQQPQFGPSQQTLVAQQRLRDLQSQGAGLNRIQNPVLHALARIGDVAGTILTPGVAAAIPGTTLHNRVLQAQQSDVINNDVAQDQARAQALQQGLQAQDTQAQIAQRNAQTAQIPILTRAKQMQAQQVGAQHGLKPSFDDNGNQTGWEQDPESPVTQRLQAQNDYFSARKELADAQADLAKSKNDPNSPAFKQAQQRILVAQRNAQTAAGRLGLSNEQYLMHAYGTDAQGNPLPGSLQSPDGTPVGTAFQGNVKPTTGQRDAAGRAQTGEDLRQRILSQLQDPEVQAGLGPMAGRVSEGKSAIGVLSPKMSQFYNDLKSYGAFQAGMHPVRGIGA
jgi:hypothetical protein